MRYKKSIYQNTAHIVMKPFGKLRIEGNKHFKKEIIATGEPSHQQK
jgi:hypothetical protein